VTGAARAGERLVFRARDATLIVSVRRRLTAEEWDHLTRQVRAGLSAHARVILLDDDVRVEGVITRPRARHRGPRPRWTVRAVGGR